MTVLSLAWLAWIVAAAEPHQVDSSVVGKVLAANSLAVPRSPVDDWMVVGPLADSAIILRQGTEVARVPWDRRLEADRSSAAPVSGPFDATLLSRWMAPRRGLEISSGFWQGISPGTNPFAALYTESRFQKGLGEWVTLGGMGRLDRVTASPPIAVPLGDSIIPLVWEWGASVCGPVVCLERWTRTLPIGSETWLQHRFSDNLSRREPGDFWVASGDSGYKPSASYRAIARMGNLEYSVEVCQALWSGSLQSLGWHQQSGAVAWGTGFLWTRERMVSWGELGISDRTLPLVRVRGQELHWSPLLFRLDWRNFRQFSIGLRTSVKIPDPTPPLRGISWQ